MYKSQPIKRVSEGNQDKLPPHIKNANKKGSAIKRFCGGKSKPFKRMKKY